MKKLDYPIKQDQLIIYDENKMVYSFIDPTTKLKRKLQINRKENRL